MPSAGTMSMFSAERSTVTLPVWITASFCGDLIWTDTEGCSAAHPDNRRQHRANRTKGRTETSKGLIHVVLIEITV